MSYFFRHGFTLTLFVVVSASCAKDSAPGDDPDASPAMGGDENPAAFDPADPSKPYLPAVEAGTLSTEITNALFPAPVGARWARPGDLTDS